MTYEEDVAFEKECCLVHADGWLYYAHNREDEGLITIGMREWQDEEKKFVDRGMSILIADIYLGKLVEVLQEFLPREDEN